MVVGGRLETGSDGTVGKSGAEPRCGGVCIRCVWLRRFAGAPKKAEEGVVT